MAENSGTRITKTVPVAGGLDNTPELWVHQAYSYPLDEASFLRLTQPDSLKMRAGERLLFPGFFWLVALLVNWRDTSRPPNWWAVSVGVAAMLIGAGLWIAGRMWPDERKVLLGQIRTYFENNRPRR